MPGIDETGISTDPSDACALCEIALEDGTGIRIVAVLYWTSNLPLDEFNEFFHSGREDVVIVFAAGVGGHPRP